MPSLIRKRTSKATGKVSWQVQIPVGTKNDGSTDWYRRTFELRRDAKAHLDEKLRERGQPGGVVKPTEATVAAYLVEWLESVQHTVRENTHEVYSGMIRIYIEPLLGSRKLADLHPMAIQKAYADLLGRGLSSRTVRYCHSILRSALGQAVKWRMIPANPTEGVELPKHQPTREMRPLTAAESRRFLAAARKERLGAFFELALVTGMRPSALFGLRWKDVDLGVGMIRVRHSLVRDKKGWRLREPKTDRGKRSIPIPPQTAEVLQTWKVGQATERMEAGGAWKGDHNPANGFVFTTLTGGPLEIRNVSLRNLVRVARDAGLAEEIPPKPPRKKPTYRSLISLYDLRHTCATLMLEAGVNPKVASERLGHSSVVITLDTYSHVMPTMQRDATEKLAGALYGS